MRSARLEQWSRGANHSGSLTVAPLVAAVLACLDGGGPTPTLDIAAFKFGYTPDPFTATDNTIIVGVLDSKHTFTAVDGSCSPSCQDAARPIEARSL